MRLNVRTNTFKVPFFTGCITRLEKMLSNKLNCGNEGEFTSVILCNLFGYQVFNGMGNYVS
jgi:hypothetical protein